MDIVSTLPNDLLILDNVTDVEIRASGITAGMGLASFNIVPGSSAAESELFISTAGLDDVVLANGLSGAGVLFDLYVTLRQGSGCPPGDNLIFAEDLTQISEVAGLELGESINLDFADGKLCTSNEGCLQGDLNNDSKVDDEDAQMILDIFTRTVPVPTDACFPFAGDINLDGKINSQDAALIRRFAKGIPINPPPPSSPKALEALQVGSFAFRSQDDPQPEVHMLPVTGKAGELVKTFLILEDGAPTAGFTATAGYPADQVSEDLGEGRGTGKGLTLVSVKLGPALVESGFLLSYNDEFASESKKLITIAAANPDSLNLKSSLELIEITFKVNPKEGIDDPDSDVAVEVAIPVVLTGYIAIDQFGHAPRHGAPGQASIVVTRVVIIAEGEGEGEGEGDGANEGEGEGDGAGEGTGEGSGEGSGEGEGDDAKAGCAVTPGLSQSEPFQTAAGDFPLLILVAIALVTFQRRRENALQR